MKRTLTVIASVMFALTTGSMLQSVRAFAQPMNEVAPSYYLALGDALSLGPTAKSLSNRRTCAGGAATSGFVCPLWRSLRQSEPGVKEVNLALATTPAEDSCSFRAIVSCTCGDCLHYGPADQPMRENALAGDRPGYDLTSVSQLAAADGFIDEHPGQVKVISLEIGGADLQEMAASEPLSPAAEESWAGRLSENYAAIVSDLRQAAPDAILILIDAVDPFAPLTKSRDLVVRAIALHMAPFYAAFARVVTSEARARGAVDAGVWHAFHASSAHGLWRTNSTTALTSAGFRLYTTAVERSYTAFNVSQHTFLPALHPVPRPIRALS